MNLQASQSFLSKNWKVISILSFFTVLYSLISLVNHYNFRTHALDLGMFNHALHSYSQGKTAYFTLDMNGNSPNYLADHFSPITMLYVPFYYLFGSWTLLIIQIISILIGALGCYKVAQIKLPKYKSHLFVLLLFLSQWAIVSALAFDFHNNVVAAMLVPWLYYYYLKKIKINTILIFLLLLITKENISLWLVFILMGFMLEKGFKHFYHNFKNYLTYEIILLSIAGLYFLFIVAYVMPNLSQGEAINQMERYGHLGNSIGEITLNLLLHPIDTFLLLFQSPFDDPISFGIKKELHFVVLLSGGFALLLRPAYLWMLLPIYAQKLFASNLHLWGISGQYSIEFTPIICLAFIDLIRKFGEWKYTRHLIFVSVLLVILTNVKTLRTRKSAWYDRTNYDYTSIVHYSSDGLDVEFVRRELKKIPDDIPISVSSCFAPHLANREKIYYFPVIKDAEMLVLIKDKNRGFPLTIEELQIKTDELVRSGQYKIILDKKNLLILSKSNDVDSTGKK